MDRDLQCYACQTSFNSGSNYPRVLPACGHSVCEQCLAEAVKNDRPFVCPVDNVQCTIDRNYENLPKNVHLVNLVAKQRRCATTIIITPEDEQNRHSARDVSEFSGCFEQSSKSQPISQPISQTPSVDNLPKANLCEAHGKIFELFCVDCSQLVCANCVLFGTHKYHTYKPIEVYLKELDQTINEITPIYKEVQEFCSEISNNKFALELDKAFSERKELAKQSVEQSFAELYTEIDKLKVLLISKLEQRFEITKSQEQAQFLTDFTHLKHGADAWIQTTGEQLKVFSDKSQKQPCLHLDHQILSQGKTYCNDYRMLNQRLHEAIKQCDNDQRICTPVQQIKQAISSQLSAVEAQTLTGAPQSTRPAQNNFEKVQTQEFMLIDDTNKLGDSDIFIPGGQFEQKPQTAAMAPRQYFMESQPQSQQPTQPTSPTYDMGKQANYFQAQTFTPQMPHRKERSHTTFQTEPADLSGSLTNRLKTKVSPKQLKFTANPKMNEKIAMCLGQIQEDKVEIVDLSQIDFNDSIISALDECVRGKKQLKVLKLSKCKITDDLFQKLIFSLQESYVNTLHLQQNMVSEKSLDFLLGHVKKSELFVHLKSIYLNSNNLLAQKAKKKIDDLKKLGITVQV